MPLPLIPVLLWGTSLATAVFGAKKGYDAYSDKKDADRYNKSASAIFEESQKALDDQRKITNNDIVKFGEYKVDIFNSSMIKFIDIFSRIVNFEYEQDMGLDGEFNITEKEFEALKAEILDIKTMLGGGVVSVGAGAAAGFGAFGLTGALATASTGTAIGSLSGVAATNATLAWLGGGSLASGGLGMAGGMAVLGGLVTGPALAVAGWVLSAKAEAAKNEAYSNLQKARAIEESNKTVVLQLQSVSNTIKSVTNTLSKLAVFFNDPLLKNLENLVNENNDASLYSQAQQAIVENALYMAQTINNLLSVALMDENGEITKEIRAARMKADRALKKMVSIDAKYK